MYFQFCLAVEHVKHIFVKVLIIISIMFNFTEPRFNEVSLTLTSSDIRETVTSILQKCNLPLNYVKSVPIPDENPPENAKAKFPRPVKWEPSFYSTYGIPDPYGVPCKIKVESILR